MASKFREYLMSLADRVEKMPAETQDLILRDISEAGPFICGHGGEKDGNGLPDRLHVCAAQGSDVIITYQRLSKE